MVKLIKPGTDYPSSFIMIIMHNVLWISYITVLWMSPIILLPHFKQRHDASEYCNWILLYIMLIE